MKHKIEIAPNLAIYIDGERVIGSKPYELFLTTEMIVSDEDLKKLSDRCLEVKNFDRKTKQMANDLIRKSDVLETYADLYDIFDDNKTIQEELHKVFDKINNIPVVESSNSEKPNNSTISKMEQVDKDINVRSKDEPQTIRCPKCGRSDYIREFGKDFSVTAEKAGFKYKCINCNTYIEPQIERNE